jgi:predicted dehydrogenase
VIEGAACEVKAVLPDADVVADPNALATRPDVDLVVIASANETHAPLAEAAIRAGAMDHWNSIREADRAVKQLLGA